MQQTRANQKVTAQLRTAGTVALMSSMLFNPVKSAADYTHVLRNENRTVSFAHEDQNGVVGRFKMNFQAKCEYKLDAVTENDLVYRVSIANDLSGYPKGNYMVFNVIDKEGKSVYPAYKNTALITFLGDRIKDGDNVALKMYYREGGVSIGYIDYSNKTAFEFTVPKFGSEKFTSWRHWII